mmetsp:Transcript_22295/g.79513  ORF Transcript_22295/g.79513 Transcript_22295/m.79513 type:complete len:323 (+) Transcript_22295:718-1686(+)
MPGLMMPVSTRPTGTVPMPPILYTSWSGRGSGFFLRGARGGGGGGGGGPPPPPPPPPGPPEEKAAAPAAPGCVQDWRHRHSPRGPRRDGHHQAGHDRHVRARAAHDGGQVRRDAPRVAPGGGSRRQRRLQREERVRQGSAPRLRLRRLQAGPAQGRRHVLRAGHHHEPPGPDLGGLLACARLPHGPRRVQVRRAQPEDGPPLGQGARGEPQVRQVGRRVHGHACAHQAAVRRVVRRVPAVGPLRRARHAPDGRRRCHQGCHQDGQGGHQDQGRRQEEVAALQLLSHQRRAGCCRGALPSTVYSLDHQDAIPSGKCDENTPHC